jgi:hypothetical protein
VERTAGLARADTPHNNPYPIHAARLLECSSVSVNRTSKVSNSVVRLVSQTTTFESAIEYGKKAQIHPAQAAVRSPKILRAIKYTGTHVKEENRLFRVKITRAEAVVYTPKILKTPATRYV